MNKARALPTLKWLIKSFEVTNFEGSAHNYSHWLNGGDGWVEAYPETTGYIIETLLDYDLVFPEYKLKALARKQCYWLLSQQFSSGAFPSGKIGGSTPSIFNSGQILFGLMDGWKLTQKEEFHEAIISCVEWLIAQLDNDNKWSNYNWVEGHNPAYLTRVIWPILQAAELLGQDQWTQWIYPCFEYYRRQRNENYSYKNWGFYPKQASYTHTIAYTLRGLLESALLLGSNETVLDLEGTASKIVEIYRTRGFLAGSYTEDWQGDYSFICVTGHAQLSLFFSRFFELTHKVEYQEMASSLFRDIEEIPSKNNIVHSLRGAVPGSVPIHSQYNRLRYPNWAAKFYLDASLSLG